MKNYLHGNNTDIQPLGCGLKQKNWIKKAND